MGSSIYRQVGEIGKDVGVVEAGKRVDGAGEGVGGAGEGVGGAGGAGEPVLLEFKQTGEYLTGMRMLSRLAYGSVLLLLLAAAGCGPSIDTLEGFKHPNVGGPKRAAFEMGCPEQELQLIDLGRGTVGVTGCGKRAVYKYVWETGWVNNTASSDPKAEQK